MKRIAGYCKIPEKSLKLKFSMILSFVYVFFECKKQGKWINLQLQNWAFPWCTQENKNLFFYFFCETSPTKKSFAAFLGDIRFVLFHKRSALREDPTIQFLKTAWWGKNSDSSIFNAITSIIKTEAFFPAFFRIQFRWFAFIHNQFFLIVSHYNYIVRSLSRWNLHEW